jgi:hypothetical protein
LKCPKCGKAFILTVAADGTLSASLVPQPPGEANAATIVSDPSAAPAAEVSFTIKQAPVGATPIPTAAFASAPPAATDSAGAADKGALGADVPRVIGNYEIIRCLGKGGMGAVYLARQRSLDRPAALKVIHPRWAADPRFLVRFTREAYAAAQLVHHNVVQVYDIGADQGTHWFSMEYVDGTSLGAMLAANGPMEPRTAAGYILQAARGLQFAHERGMVHRDVKPDNLMLNKQSVVKVADLGLVCTPGAVDEVPRADRTKDAGAKTAATGTLASLVGVTHVNQTMGTPAYMAPEQIRSASTVDERADIYSLGCTLYALLTNRPVFPAKTPQEMMKKQQSEAPTPPETYVKSIPKALSDIILRTLAKNPSDRYPSTADFVRALEGFLDLGGSAQAQLAEQHAAILEQGAAAFRSVAVAPWRSLAIAVGLALCGLGFAISALVYLLTGRGWMVAGSFLGLAVLTPLMHFVVHGVATRSYLLRLLRQHVLGCDWRDGLKAAGIGLLLVLLLALTGLFWPWLFVCGFAALFACAIYFLLDRPLTQQRQAALVEVEQMLKGLRLRGIAEDEIQRFICRFAGEHWEPLFEELFGYEAKLAARAKWGAGPKGPRPTFAAWRDPLVRWIHARERARQEARDRKHLQAIEQQNLVAEGMQPAEAQRQAEAVADAMVEKAHQFKEAEFVDEALVEEVARPIPQMKTLPHEPATAPARTTEDFGEDVDMVEIIETAPPPQAPVPSPPPAPPRTAPPPPAPPRPRVDVRELVAVAEKPPPRPRRPGPSLGDRVLAAGTRFLVGVCLLGASVAGLYFIDFAEDLKAVSPLDLDSWKALAAKLLEPRLLALDVAIKPLTCLAAAAAGLLLALSSFQPIRGVGLLHYGCAIVMIAGPWLGVPAVESLDPAIVSLAAGGAFSLVLLVLAGLGRR